MFGIKEKTAGVFIELETMISQIQDEEIDLQQRELIAANFLLLLFGVDAVDKLNEDEVITATQLYISEVAELKSNYEWIYNPPSLPTSSEQVQNTQGDEYRKEFAETYGGFANLIFLIGNTFKVSPTEIYNWKTVDFLFWGNYLSHQKSIEGIK